MVKVLQLGRMMTEMRRRELLQRAFTTLTAVMIMSAPQMIRLGVEMPMTMPLIDWRESTEDWLSRGKRS